MSNVLYKDHVLGGWYINADLVIGFGLSLDLATWT